MIYLAIVMLAVLLTAAGIWRCDLYGNYSQGPIYDESMIPPPPEPPPMIHSEEVAIWSKNNDYMVLMGAEKREISCYIRQDYYIIDGVKTVIGEEYVNKGVEDEFAR